MSGDCHGVKRRVQSWESQFAFIKHIHSCIESVFIYSTHQTADLANEKHTTVMRPRLRIRIPNDVHTTDIFGAYHRVAQSLIILVDLDDLSASSVIVEGVNWEHIIKKNTISLSHFIHKNFAITT